MSALKWSSLSALPLLLSEAMQPGSPQRTVDQYPSAAWQQPTASVSDAGILHAELDLTASASSAIQQLL